MHESLAARRRVSTVAGRHEADPVPKQQDLTRMYPSVAAAALQLDAESVVIDGEIVVVGPDAMPSSQALQHRGCNLAPQIIFYAFDALHVYRRDVKGEPLTTQREEFCLPTRRTLR
jgi:ATP-dependent DNA ligase